MLRMERPWHWLTDFELSDSFEVHRCREYGYRLLLRVNGGRIRRIPVRLIRVV